MAGTQYVVDSPMPLVRQGSARLTGDIAGTHGSGHNVFRHYEWRNTFGMEN